VGTKATRVEYVNLMDVGTNYTTLAKAKKEVIVTAGALGTPHLLMVSGVGDAVALNSTGITVVSNVPGVGKSLFDQFVLQMDFLYRNNTGLSLPTLVSVWPEEDITYVINRTGLFTSLAGYITDLWVSSTGNNNLPNFQIVFYPEISQEGGIIAHLELVLVTPTTRGIIQLTSPDPLVLPTIIYPELELVDINKYVWAVEFVRNLTLHYPWNATLENEVQPGSQYTGEALREYIKQHVTRKMHHTGTASIGDTQTNPQVVVDADLKVKGTTFLRVVDGSVLPLPGIGTPQATIMMLAEKASVMILKDWGINI